MAKRAILPVFVPHLGCPCQCVFCNQNAIAGQGTPVTAQEIQDRAQSAHEAGLPTPEIAFYGGSFTAIAADQQEGLLAAAQQCIRRGLATSIRVSTRPDCISSSVCARLKQYGVRTVELGAQSLDDTVLRLAARGHTAKQIEEASQMLKAEGFQTILQLMAGLPGETDRIAAQSARRAAALAPHGVRIYPVAVLPNTVLYQWWRAGTYVPLTVQQAASRCADMLEIFEQEQIPVLRVGLNPTEDLGAQIVAGAYHPAMGELAWNEVWRRRMQGMLAPYVEKKGTAVFTVPQTQVSKAVGQKRCNLLRLAAAFPDIRIRVLPSEKIAQTELAFLDLDENQ